LHGDAPCIELPASNSNFKLQLSLDCQFSASTLLEGPSQAWANIYLEEYQWNANYNFSYSVFNRFPSSTSAPSVSKAVDDYSTPAVPYLGFARPRNNPPKLAFSWDPLSGNTKLPLVEITSMPINWFALADTTNAQITKAMTIEAFQNSTFLQFDWNLDFARSEMPIPGFSTSMLAIHSPSKAFRQGGRLVLQQTLNKSTASRKNVKLTPNNNLLFIQDPTYMPDPAPLQPLSTTVKIVLIVLFLALFTITIAVLRSYLQYREKMEFKSMVRSVRLNRQQSRSSSSQNHVLEQEQQ
jgi:hypothetical protein